MVVNVLLLVKLLEVQVSTLRKINTKKNNKKIKKILSTDIRKLKSFTPPSEILPRQNSLYFLKPIIRTKLVNNQKNKRRFFKKKEKWSWQSETINVYLFKQAKDDNIDLNYSFIEYFKVYKSLSNVQNFSKKINRIKIFLKWLAGNENYKLLTNKQTIFLTINFFNFLTKTARKYKTLK